MDNSKAADRLLKETAPLAFKNASNATVQYPESREMVDTCIQLVSVQRLQYTAANRTTVQLVGLSVLQGNTARCSERQAKGARSCCLAGWPASRRADQRRRFTLMV